MVILTLGNQLNMTNAFEAKHDAGSVTSILSLKYLKIFLYLTLSKETGQYVHQILVWNSATYVKSIAEKWEILNSWINHI